MVLFPFILAFVKTIKLYLLGEDDFESHDVNTLVGQA